MKEFVYIVDDDEAVRDSLRWLLEGNGFSVKFLVMQKNCWILVKHKVMVWWVV